MTLKWIVCDVIPDRRDSFHRAQQEWRTLATVDGFCAQVGGWGTRHPARACILAAWRDSVALDSFMRHHHDPIFTRSRQSETYTSSNVTIVEADAVIPFMEVSEIRIDGRAIDLFAGERSLCTIPSSIALDADRILIEPAWRVIKP